MSNFLSLRVCAAIACFVLAVCVSFTTQKLNKDARCHMLKNPGCNVSIYPILDWEPAGYFYHAPFRSCRSFYAPRGAVCPQNRDLPLTKRECEDVCGEKCKMPDGSYGICEMEGSCDVVTPASWNPRPCGAYNVICCPTSTYMEN